MAIEYDFYLNPNLQGTNKKRYHARVVSNNRVSTDELAKEIQSECVYTGKIYRPSHPTEVGGKW